MKNNDESENHSALGLLNVEEQLKLIIQKYQKNDQEISYFSLTVTQEHRVLVGLIREQN